MTQQYCFFVVGK